MVVGIVKINNYIFDIPNRNEVENLKTTLQDYTDGQISNLNSVLGKEIDSKIKILKMKLVQM